MTSDGAPGIITELVPLPLLYSVPGTGEPGIMTFGLLPLPVSNPEPPEVVAVRGADVIPPDGAFGEATGAGEATPRVNWGAGVAPLNCRAGVVPDCVGLAPRLS